MAASNWKGDASLKLKNGVAGSEGDHISFNALQLFYRITLRSGVYTRMCTQLKSTQQLFGIYTGASQLSSEICNTFMHMN